MVSKSCGLAACLNVCSLKKAELIALAKALWMAGGGGDDASQGGRRAVQGVFIGRGAAVPGFAGVYSFPYPYYRFCDGARGAGGISAACPERDRRVYFMEPDAGLSDFWQLWAFAVGDAAVFRFVLEFHGDGYGDIAGAVCDRRPGGLGFCGI